MESMTNKKKTRKPLDPKAAALMKAEARILRLLDGLDYGTQCEILRRLAYHIGAGQRATSLAEPEREGPVDPGVPDLTDLAGTETLGRASQYIPYIPPSHRNPDILRRARRPDDLVVPAPGAAPVRRDSLANQKE